MAYYLFPPTPVTVDVPPLEFRRDGADQQVVEDTGTPANNRPLPVIILDTTGNVNAIDLSSSVADNDADSGNPIKIGGVYNSTPPTYDDGDRADLQVDSNGNLKTAITGLPASLGQKASAASLATVLSSEQEAILSAIRTAVELIDNAISGTEMQVDLVGIGDVATETTLASLAAEDFATETTLDAIKTAVEILDNAISGTEMQVDLVDIGDAATETTQSAMSAKLPASLGAKAGSSSISIVPATDASFIGGLSAVDTARNDYSSGNVTTSAYTQLVASLGSACKEVEIFDSSGQTLLLATGAAASETDQIYIIPGGNGRVPLSIAASTRVSVKAVSATADSGEITINFYG